jgi:hypothetical protein
VGVRQIFVSWSLHITKDYGTITDKMETTVKKYGMQKERRTWN